MKTYILTLKFPANGRKKKIHHQLPINNYLIFVYHLFFFLIEKICLNHLSSWDFIMHINVLIMFYNPCAEVFFFKLLFNQKIYLYYFIYLYLTFYHVIYIIVKFFIFIAFIICLLLFLVYLTLKINNGRLFFFHTHVYTHTHKYKAVYIWFE